MATTNLRRARGGPNAAGEPLADAHRILARRPLTDLELRSRLTAMGHGPEAVDRVAERLLKDGLLDDQRLASHFILTRAARLGHGRRRLLRDLERRGVAPATARGAWDEAVRVGDLDPLATLRREIARRVASLAGRVDGKAYGRMYNALFRAGFEASTIEAALDGAGLDASRGASPERVPDDFA